ncbi:O-antigen ligase family protein [Aureisphaera galaxeae]|uniref:O-antigen ligase family protein n=1 Tax=Aureisphaera galaxeae TaxID=1538023 RepID=UPI00234FC7A5|nr:O-antigen ligase family protein [Aureisphaera galaxeae]MDC8005069.1 O-antigen ligase family protein [Aureisphaera galaxeae]
MRILFASIYPYVFLLLFFTIPFDNYLRALPNILLAILAILFPFIVRKNHILRLKRMPTILLGVFVGYLVLNALVFGRLEEDWVVLKKVLLSLGLVVLYIPIDGFKKIYKAVIFSSLAAIVFSLIKLVMVVNASDSFNFLDSAIIIEALLTERLYLGLLCVLSILASYQSMRDTYHPDNPYYVANIILNVLFVLLIVSRISIIVLLVIFVLSFFYKKKRLPQMFFVTGGFLLAIILTFILNNDLRNQIFYSGSQHNDGLIENTLAVEPRAVIWDCAHQVSKMEGTLLKGQGFTQTNREMLLCYETSVEDERKQAWFLSQKYNTHNQFIDFYLACGAIGLLLFLGSIVILFVRNRKAYLPTALLFTLVSFALVENLFHRQIGAYYVGFIFIMLLIAEAKSENTALNEP